MTFLLIESAMPPVCNLRGREKGASHVGTWRVHWSEAPPTCPSFLEVEKATARHPRALAQARQATPELPLKFRETRGRAGGLATPPGVGAHRHP